MLTLRRLLKVVFDCRFYIIATNEAKETVTLYDDRLADEECLRNVLDEFGYKPVTYVSIDEVDNVLCIEIETEYEQVD